MDGPFAEGKELVLPGFAAPEKGHGAYASVNGLRMYYEVHGRGRPLVLLHGALTTIDGTFGNVLRALASTRQVIAIEQQAHGRTADIARPLSYEQMADDSAELLHQIACSRDRAPSTVGGVALGLLPTEPRSLPLITAIVGLYVSVIVS